MNVPAVGSYKPLTDIEADWVPIAPENVGCCSAVAWYFAHFIQQYLDIPVGIINASYGGSVVEGWMSRETCSTLDGISVPELSDGTTEWWEANIPTTMYNGMLNPIVGYGIQGCIWYQGESNVYNVPRYSDHLVAMVAEWRENGGEISRSIIHKSLRLIIQFGISPVKWEHTCVMNSGNAWIE